MQYTWRFDVVWRFLPYLVDGLKMTLLVTIAAMILGILAGLMAALMRLSKLAPLRFLGAAYVDFFRSTPPMIQLIWIYYCLPIVLGIEVPALISGAIALSVSTGSFLAEIFRGGILSIEKGQREAAIALGMTSSQSMRRIILPQAIRRMIPPITNVFISTLKASSLVGTVAIADLMWQSNNLIMYTFRPLEILTVTAAIYFLLTYPQVWISNRIYERIRVR